MDSKQQILAVCLMVLLLGPVMPAFGYESWQLNRLLHPQLEHLNQEAEGLIFIYDGLYDEDIESALTSHFHRIDNMMFIRTKVIVDGEVEEMDDCD